MLLVETDLGQTVGLIGLERALEPGRDGRGEPGGGAAAARVGLHLRLELQDRTDGGRHSAVVKVAVTVQLPWHSGSTGRQPAVGFSYDHI